MKRFFLSASVFFFLVSCSKSINGGGKARFDPALLSQLSSQDFQCATGVVGASDIFTNGEPVVINYGCIIGRLNNSESPVITDLKHECSMDNGPFEECPGKPASYSNLSEGEHLFQYRATVSGEVSSTAQSYTFVVDRSSPVILPLAGNSALRTSTESETPQFEYTINDATVSSVVFSGINESSVKCQVVGQTALESCSKTAKTISRELPNGSYVFYIRASDLAGNTTELREPFRVQRIPLAAYGSCQITATIPDVSSSTSHLVPFNCASDNGDELIEKYECRLDNSGWEECQASPGYQLTNLSHGQHNVQIRYKNNADIYGGFAHIAFKTDILGPSVREKQSPITSYKDMTLYYSVEDLDSMGVKSVTCTLKKGNTVIESKSCPGEQVKFNHTFEEGKNYSTVIEAIDILGNPSEGSEKYVYDFTAQRFSAPRCFITREMVKPNRLSQQSIGFSCNSGVPLVKTLCKVGSGSWDACSSSNGHDFVSSRSGLYRFYVKSQDILGKESVVAQSSSYVDKNAPRVKILEVESQLSPQAKVHFNADDLYSNGSANPGSKGLKYVQCRLNNGSWSNCTSPKILSGLTHKKSYSVSVRAIDKSGYTTTVSKSFVSTKPYVAPVCNTTASVPTKTRAPTTTIKLSCSGNRTPKVQCKFGAAKSWTTVIGNSYTVNNPLSGKATIMCRSLYPDSPELPGPIMSVTYSVDRVRPAVSIRAPSFSGNNAKSSFSGSDSNGISKFYCESKVGTSTATIAASQFKSLKACSSPYTVSGGGAAGKTVHLYVKAVDSFGNSTYKVLKWINAKWSSFGSCSASCSKTSGVRRRTCSSKSTYGRSCTGSATANCSLTSSQVKVCDNLQKVWINHTGSQSCFNACSLVGKSSMPSPEGMMCASGELKPASNGAKINYIYGKLYPPVSKLTNSQFGSYCYFPGQKHDNDGTDRTVACHCGKQPAALSYKVFSYKKIGSNSGISGTVSCPSGQKISNIRAACNLEYGSVSDTYLKALRWGGLRVAVESDNRSSGQCVVGATSINSGERSLSMTALRKLRSVKVSCKEHDGNGGDCHIRGHYTCK